MQNATVRDNILLGKPFDAGKRSSSSSSSCCCS